MPGKASCKKWRKAFSKSVIPNLVAFQPDFIIVSAGFDAHEKDHIHHNRDTSVTEFEYRWVTEQLTMVANTYCQGRIVSILEGGYSTKSGPISPLAQSVSSHVRALLKSDYSQLVGIKENGEVDFEQYQSECKMERSLLKKRRMPAILDQNPYSFMRMTLRKRQRTDEAANEGTIPAGTLPFREE